ncbi:hypothetical protein [Nonomuraea typhae]|uniref:hypothetical protein n=1 Tax=Nonomuraea typhae TaxID=2603600 RepID=UPI0012FB8EC0|nr:hypothetical protein [Nonomuraea typhae]
MVEISINPKPARNERDSLWTMAARLTPDPITPCRLVDAPEALQRSCGHDQRQAELPELTELLSRRHLRREQEDKIAPWH